MTRTSKSLMTAALGGLMLAATIQTASAEEKAAEAGKGDTKMGQCHGVNACKGKGACHGEGVSCAGNNACKGKGWIKASKADCEKQGGTYKEG